MGPSKLVSTFPRLHKKASNDSLLNHIRLGDRVEIYWPKMKQYYPGMVTLKTRSGKHRVEYDDGDVEVLRMEKEKWRFCNESAERIAIYILGSMKERKTDDQSNNPSPEAIDKLELEKLPWTRVQEANILVYNVRIPRGLAVTA